MDRDGELRRRALDRSFRAPDTRAAKARTEEHSIPPRRPHDGPFSPGAPLSICLHEVTTGGTVVRS
jgi:hypothetical protein